jgi:hypothetical protein
VRDPVQPRPQVQLALAGADRAVGVEERLLDRVLGALGRQQPPAEAQQRAPVARDDRLERPVVTGAREVHQPIVALRVEQGGTR